MIPKLTTEEFIKKAKEKHGDKYNYSKVEYIKNNINVTIICNTHGDFEQMPGNHLTGSGCNLCGYVTGSSKQSSNTEQFVEKAKKVHGDKYDYNLVKYTTCKNKVAIICEKHGQFCQMPSLHLSGSGCYFCGNESHWKRSDYAKKAKGRVCIFYIIRCFNENESFYKIGITMNSVKYRHKKNKMPYMYEIISEVYGEASQIWDLELSEKRKLKEFNYQPKIKFPGAKTECFTQYKIEN